MTAIAVPISEDKQARLQILAEKAGVSLEQFVAQQLDQVLEQSEKTFDNNLRYVLEKNAELYRRLA